MKDAKTIFDSLIENAFIAEKGHVALFKHDQILARLLEVKEYIDAPSDTVRTLSFTNHPSRFDPLRPVSENTQKLYDNYLGKTAAICALLFPKKSSRDKAPDIALIAAKAYNKNDFEAAYSKMQQSLDSAVKFISKDAEHIRQIEGIRYLLAGLYCMDSEVAPFYVRLYEADIKTALFGTNNPNFALFAVTDHFVAYAKKVRSTPLMLPSLLSLEREIISPEVVNASQEKKKKPSKNTSDQPSLAQQVLDSSKLDAAIKNKSFNEAAIKKRVKSTIAASVTTEYKTIYKDLPREEQATLLHLLCMQLSESHRKDNKTPTQLFVSTAWWNAHLKAFSEVYKGKYKSEVLPENDQITRVDFLQANRFFFMKSPRHVAELDQLQELFFSENRGKIKDLGLIVPPLSKAEKAITEPNVVVFRDSAISHTVSSKPQINTPHTRTKVLRPLKSSGTGVTSVGSKIVSQKLPASSPKEELPPQKEALPASTLPPKTTLPAGKIRNNERENAFLAGLLNDCVDFAKKGIRASLSLFYKEKDPSSSRTSSRRGSQATAERPKAPSRIASLRSSLQEKLRGSLPLNATSLTVFDENAATLPGPERPAAASAQVSEESLTSSSEIAESATPSQKSSSATSSSRSSVIIDITGTTLPVSRAATPALSESDTSLSPTSSPRESLEVEIAPKSTSEANVSTSSIEASTPLAFSTPPVSPKIFGHKKAASTNVSSELISSKLPNDSFTIDSVNTMGELGSPLEPSSREPSANIIEIPPRKQHRRSVSDSGKVTSYRFSSRLPQNTSSLSEVQTALPLFSESSSSSIDSSSDETSPATEKKSFDFITTTAADDSAPEDTKQPTPLTASKEQASISRLREAIVNFTQTRKVDLDPLAAKKATRAFNNARLADQGERLKGIMIGWGLQGDTTTYCNEKGEKQPCYLLTDVTKGSLLEEAFRRYRSGCAVIGYSYSEQGQMHAFNSDTPVDAQIRTLTYNYEQANQNNYNSGGKLCLIVAKLKDGRVVDQTTVARTSNTIFNATYRCEYTAENVLSRQREAANKAQEIAKPLGIKDAVRKFRLEQFTKEQSKRDKSPEDHHYSSITANVRRELKEEIKNLHYAGVKYAAEATPPSPKPTSSFKEKLHQEQEKKQKENNTSTSDTQREPVRMHV